jgi:hypothetical protein
MSGSCCPLCNCDRIKTPVSERFLGAISQSCFTPASKISFLNFILFIAGVVFLPHWMYELFILKRPFVAGTEMLTRNKRLLLRLLAFS